jgi:hypothetical protein
MTSFSITGGLLANLSLFYKSLMNEWVKTSDHDNILLIISFVLLSLYSNYHIVSHQIDIYGRIFCTGHFQVWKLPIMELTIIDWCLCPRTPRRTEVAESLFSSIMGCGIYASGARRWGHCPLGTKCQLQTKGDYSWTLRLMKVTLIEFELNWNGCYFACKKEKHWEQLGFNIVDWVHVFEIQPPGSLYVATCKEVRLYEFIRVSLL